MEYVTKITEMVISPEVQFKCRFLKFCVSSSAMVGAL